MTPLPAIDDDSHTPINHRLFMAQFNRKHAHAYRVGSRRLGAEIPGQFYWHMREAIRWIQIEKYHRSENHAAR